MPIDARSIGSFTLWVINIMNRAQHIQQKMENMKKAIGQSNFLNMLPFFATYASWNMKPMLFDE